MLSDIAPFGPELFHRPSSQVELKKLKLYNNALHHTLCWLLKAGFQLASLIDQVVTRVKIPHTHPCKNFIVSYGRLPWHAITADD